MFVHPKVFTPHLLDIIVRKIFLFSYSDISSSIMICYWAKFFRYVIIINIINLMPYSSKIWYAENNLPLI